MAGSLVGLAAPALPSVSDAAPHGAAATPALATASSTPTPPSPARALVAADARGASLSKKHPNESYVRASERLGSGGRHFVLLERSFRGVPVVGGEAIVTTDETGTIRDTTEARPGAAAVASTRPSVTAAKATTAARQQLDTVTSAKRPRLVVDATGATPRLAWEVFVEGTKKGKESRQHVFVDARQGGVIRTHDLVVDATGTGNHVGQVGFTTTGSSGSYSMKSTAAPGLQCGGQTGTVYTDSDDVWGNGSGTDLPTACVDAMYAGEQEYAMLKAWAGRNGIDGTGKAYPARVGLNQVNAVWNGSYGSFGHNQANSKQATSMDVVGHEFGHGIFQFSGGSASRNEAGGMNESTGDIYGAATEAYANNAKDTPDYEVGEMIDLVGQGPIRYMYDPSKVGDPNCVPQLTSSTEVHAGAGPQNHWFYLLAEGNNPGGGKPTSPICSGGPSSITGIGVQKATNIFTNGLQRKTSSWTHAKERVATLTAAKDLYPGSCTEFDAVKNAWLGVGVGTQTGEPTCTASPTSDFSVSLAPTSGSVTPGASTSATVATQTTSGTAQTVSLSASGLPSGASASFSPASVTTGSSSTMTVTTGSTTPAGTYQVTVSAAGSVTKTATYTLTVGSGGPGGSTPPDISLTNMQAHLQSLQDTATSNGGNRRAGSAGYTASTTYVENKLKAAGYTVTRQRCTTCTYPSDNLIADYPGGDAAKTYMFGAHLDSVSAGPGINDNGSGSVALLENALALAAAKPTMDGHVRFAWWTDEEQGLNGSKYYVNQLTSTQKSQLKAYYNFDMIASKNGGYFINHVTSAAAAPMKAYWDSLNLQPEENTEGAGRSDDYSFEQAGIATSGYAMGASARKTSAQASKWGGTANAAYDSCYHSACDSYPSNINTTGLDRSADGIAYTIWKQAVGTSTPTNDFSMSLSPSSGTVNAGSSATATVSTATTSGSAQTVTLSASGLPSGATATFNPASVTTGGSSTMTVATSATTPSGTYQVTVTAGGAVSHSATYSLTVNGSTPGGCTTKSFTNGTDYPIRDNATASSPVTSTCADTVTSVTAAYDIYHSCEEDFGVVLVAPDGRSYTLETASYGSCGTRDGFTTKTVPVTSVSAQGTWTLKVTDYYTGDTGTLYSFKLTLP
ncbi:M28 family peptidase [Luteipulveratus flavus]|uniref:M20/M25/M40 family metallo-hydrolase n=1 Tax=Luteipulveratus flavus TaxID=3031728 RepID=A0ABT6C547_9MICO|nr:M28 family peptidase [Luteipulveratus sp. YIM 133296]MDF8264005.1 M20/M25/M40 family metallo-hydrolase [Luteipulveratus sp. YIM 133296]